jgi:hypothetical protein
MLNYGCLVQDDVRHLWGIRVSQKSETIGLFFQLGDDIISKEELSADLTEVWIDAVISEGVFSTEATDFLVMTSARSPFRSIPIESKNS